MKAKTTKRKLHERHAKDERYLKIISYIVGHNIVLRKSAILYRPYLSEENAFLNIEIPYNVPRKN